METSKAITSGPPGKQSAIRRLLNIPELSVAVAIVVFFALFAALDKSMLQPAQFVRLCTQSVYFAFIAFSLVYLMMAGEVDLSTGSMASFAAAVSAVLITDNGWPEWAGLSCALLAAVAVGLLNSFIVLKIGVPSFFATLGTHFVVFGLSQVLLYGRWVWISGKTPFLDALAKPSPVFALPWTFILLLGLILGGDYLVRRSLLGQVLTATGGNRRAAEVSGINTTLVKTLCFVAVSVCSAVAGFFVMQAGAAADQYIGDGWNIWVLAIAILGGASMNGGVGSIVGGFLGTLLIWVIRLGLGAARIQTNAQGIVVGAILVAAAILDVARRKAKKY
jgi:ribose/xylose/arabinose/galactoside ABC-type transport system permease subunit